MTFGNIKTTTCTLGNILYTGMMYHERKLETGHWKTLYSVVRKLEVLKKVIYHIIIDFNFTFTIAFRK